MCNFLLQLWETWLPFTRIYLFTWSVPHCHCPLTHSDALLTLLCLQHTALGCCPLPPSVSALLTPTLPNTLSWSSLPQECPSPPAWALSLHTRLHSYPHCCRYTIVTLLGLWYMQQAIPMHGCPHFTWALTPHAGQPSYADALLTLIRFWHPALSLWGGSHLIVDKYLALPHLMASGLNCSGREGKARRRLLSFKSLRALLGQWNYSVWYYNDEYMSLYIVQNVQHLM